MMNVLFQFHRKSDFSSWWFFLFAASFALMFISCSDLQKESSTSACNTALNQQNWDTAISTCTSSKGLGDAYMGKGGFNITNLLNNSGGESTPSYITNKNSNLGTVDGNAAKVLYIIGTAQSQVSSASDRATNIQNSKNAFDNASSKYSGVIASNKDAALMYTFANVFAMQLDQVLFYDTLDYACNNVACSDNYTDSSYPALVNYDGYIFPQDKTGKQASFGSDAVASATSTCTGLKSTIGYITKIADGLSKSGASTSGSSTSIISDSKTAVCSTLSTLKTACSSDSSCETACTASDC